MAILLKKNLCDVSLKGVPEGHCFILTNNYTSKKICNQAEIVIKCATPL